MVYRHYYSQFADATFVVHAEDEAVESRETMQAVLRGADDLLRHGIKVLLVVGKGSQFRLELARVYAVTTHAETNRLVIPELALPRLEQERARIIRSIEELCVAQGTAFSVVNQAAVHAERRIGHGSTGVATGFDLAAIQAALTSGHLAIVAFGGVDDSGEFLHVPSISLAAELAVALRAQKLIFLTHADGISIAHPTKGTRQLSFADLEELLCLLQRQNERCEFVLSSQLLPNVHASIRAVAGGVHQVHLVSYSRLLDEVLTRTGVGTMIECRQTHQVDYARREDLDEIERLHNESQQFRTPLGTPYVNPLTRDQLAGLLPQTLLLRHREVIIGKLHTAAVSGDAHTLQIGGFVIAENHQDSQHGQLLLSETFSRLQERACVRAVALTASPRASRLFQRLGGRVMPAASCPETLAQTALLRYQPAERHEVNWIEFLL